jgi:hypothetical protein
MQTEHFQRMCLAHCRDDKSRQGGACQVLQSQRSSSTHANSTEMKLNAAIRCSWQGHVQKLRCLEPANSRTVNMMNVTRLASASPLPNTVTRTRFKLAFRYKMRATRRTRKRRKTRNNLNNDAPLASSPSSRIASPTMSIVDVTTIKKSNWLNVDRMYSRKPMPHTLRIHYTTGDMSRR